ncbi:MAG: transcription elongation factor GreA [Phycisphaeraceae bacterium]|nr:transcription elongation factor GreA [Phycisphaeraceae bacterium]
MDYITADDKVRLEAELRTRLDQRRAITLRIEEARALGDLKENAEYHAAREDQGMNEARIRDLESRLANAIVADASELPEGMVFLGATVRVRDVENGDEESYRLVGELSGPMGADEIIEVTPGSPLGAALMKARIGEVVRVDLRRGARRFEIVEVVI